MMPIEWTPIWSAASIMTGTLLFVMGGVRFRRWAIDDRAGIPRFSNQIETIILWLVYSGAVSLAIVVVRQTLRHV